MIRTIPLLSLVVLLACQQNSFAGDFSQVKIKQPFKKYLTGKPLLMETSGTTIIQLKNDRVMVFSVASKVLKNESAKERLMAERICQVKSFAYLVGEQRGVKVFHTETVNDKTVIVIENGKETAKSVSEYLEVTKLKIEGTAKGLPIVGTWRSKDNQIYYLAIGAILDKKGEPVKLKANLNK